MYCSQCGKQNPDEAKFCAVCGAQMASSGTLSEEDRGRIQAETEVRDQTVQRRRLHRQRMATAKIFAIVIGAIVLLLIFIGVSQSMAE